MYQRNGHCRLTSVSKTATGLTDEVAGQPAATPSPDSPEEQRHDQREKTNTAIAVCVVSSRVGQTTFCGSRRASPAHEVPEPLALRTRHRNRDTDDRCHPVPSAHAAARRGPAPRSSSSRTIPPIRIAAAISNLIVSSALPFRCCFRRAFMCCILVALSRFTCRLPGERGRPGGNRTPNLRFWRPPLCQLSYWPSSVDCVTRASPFSTARCALYVSIPNRLRG